MAPSLRELSRRLRETRRAAEGVGPYGGRLRLSYSPECFCMLKFSPRGPFVNGPYSVLAA